MWGVDQTERYTTMIKEIIDLELDIVGNCPQSR
jgi:hypothetical protein